MPAADGHTDLDEGDVLELWDAAPIPVRMRDGSGASLGLVKFHGDPPAEALLGMLKLRAEEAKDADEQIALLNRMIDALRGLVEPASLEEFDRLRGLGVWKLRVVTRLFGHLLTKYGEDAGVPTPGPSAS